jgi:hypothetical protein
MASEPDLSSGDKKVAYVDAAGRETEDPGQAVSGEIAVYDAQGSPLRRTRFFLDRSELRWLPVSEPAFLLWALAALIAIWACIGIALRFFM